ncbi:DUF4190 domain-containing protein [Mycolicibacterium fortuitum]|uniref:Septum formation-related domain-containing protein n=1 Tax=Mycolicibacterium fortuitum subsp. fortuitum DSM 46621 = ATCC 6841 = JCM 6387 TaxID=1214102 RepID=K0VFQ8_MYCFO|nr:DUF4190 domain-containing protein [Mycolicibacterium fortuitum]AJR30136.1 putative membrane protein [Mycobacterium sp. VKM Ac-1817D]EJZ13723.1 hypothetical protein MFORT_13273 [Mycolicibacterium fortuitum subsp. fortuitum DSM 46621 = ATCC 6841 = JCM 6387]WEV30438.1 septum formation family protein [Mycolicibacterium fortuitum]CRL55810.1 peptidyl-prolyl cis-trans isomerase [Mycolicibacterium fortuitum subsp. fortuitum DSM 46621 = ATCC 6841 = JCM 6387]BDD99332.1 hypothetical protein MFTT_34260
MTDNSPASPPRTPKRPSPPTTGWAVAALIFGIIGGAVIGIICGLVALSKIRSGRSGGRGLAVAGLTLSGLWIVIGIIAIVVVVAVPSDSEDHFVPAAGTCFAAEPDGNFEESDVLPCDQPHKVEVFAVFTVAGDQYPGDPAAEKFVDRCNSAYAAYAAEDAPDMDIEALRPTAQTWDEGVRTVKCLAVSTDSLTGSVKG